ncbi:hypothetical protein C8R44DRAFT_392321 [Mycena epipterygia]|nr:hypothetical protein C8R44DRAFT_392321 [Mycena epipterygia]
MLPFSLKMVWFVLSLTGTIATWLVQMALGTLWGNRKAPLVFLISLTINQGMFCLGMIWRMDPFSMPRAFCIAQAILIQCSIYGLTASAMTFLVAANFHIRKPKGWGSPERTFTWHPIYILPLAVYPLVNSVLYIALVLKYDAIQPTNDFQCDASHPLWVRLVGHLSPAVILFLPSVYLSATSIRTVRRTFKHIERARCDQNELPRQIRRERHSELHSSKPFGSTSFPSSGSASSPGRQPIDPASPLHAESQRLSFHLPFLRQLQSISQTLSPPPPSPIPSVAADDGRESVASSSFPTFAPVADKPTLYARHRPDESDDIADFSSPWMDQDSFAPTSVEGTSFEGPETPEELELDIKNPVEDEIGTYRISYRESAASPSRISHVTQIPNFSSQINKLLVYQISLILGLCFESLSTIIDVARHREMPTPFATHQISRLLAAWGSVIVSNARSTCTSGALALVLDMNVAGRHQRNIHWGICSFLAFLYNQSTYLTRRPA